MVSCTLQSCKCKHSSSNPCLYKVLLVYSGWNFFLQQESWKIFISSKINTVIFVGIIRSVLPACVLTKSLHCVSKSQFAVQWSVPGTSKIADWILYVSQQICFGIPYRHFVSIKGALFGFCIKTAIVFSTAVEIFTVESADTAHVVSFPNLCLQFLNVILCIYMC